MPLPLIAYVAGAGALGVVGLILTKKKAPPPPIDREPAPRPQPQPQQPRPAPTPQPQVQPQPQPRVPEMTPEQRVRLQPDIDAVTVAAILEGSNVADAILAGTPIAPPPPPTPSLAGRQAVVTTKDPSPSGDLIIRSSPSGSAPQIGGADKNGMVTVVNPDAAGDGVWAEVNWTGGNRPAAHGFARKAYLKLI